jgi:hypothetical protein
MFRRNMCATLLHVSLLVRPKSADLVTPKGSIWSKPSVLGSSKEDPQQSCKSGGALGRELTLRVPARDVNSGPRGPPESQLWLRVAPATRKTVVFRPLRGHPDMSGSRHMCLGGLQPLAGMPPRTPSGRYAPRPQEGRPAPGPLEAAA